MTTRTVEEVLGPLNQVEIKHAPDLLYLEGDESLLQRGVRVCIIGTRKPSAHGRENARQLAEYLVRQGVTIVSGLAMGIDTEAHRTAIAAGGRTIAVLGTPLDKVNPPSNTELQREIGERHLLVSQFAQGTDVYPSNFPRRNRTMALVSNATIIVEAGETSGTLHQGFEALRLGRPLFLLNEVVANPKLTWPKKMLDYGAVAIGSPADDDAALYDALPLNLGPSAQPAF